MEAWSPGDLVPMTFDRIKEQLEELGPGSSTLIGVEWTTGGGHWFNAVNDKGVVVASDGQRGKSESWPPTPAGLGFDEADCRLVEAIVVDPDGKHLTT